MLSIWIDDGGDDESGLEWYDFYARIYDQQTGRFQQIDPWIEFGSQEILTPYQFSFNNPIRYNDPDGKCAGCPVVPYIIERVEEHGVREDKQKRCKLC